MASTSLVIGASGQVGSAIKELLGTNCVGTYSTNPTPDGIHFDLYESARDESLIAELFELVRPSVVYLCSACVSVEKCEVDEEFAYAVNSYAPAMIARISRQQGAKLVFISSDYVFDGENGPYAENDPVGPLNVYGRSKVLAEKFIQRVDSDALILRTTIVYGPQQSGQNFVYQLSKAYTKKELMFCCTDQLGTPTYSRDLALLAYGLVRARSSGIFNCTGREYMSRYDFARRIYITLGWDLSLLVPISTNQLRDRLQKRNRPYVNRGMKLGLSMDRTLDALCGEIHPRSIEQSISHWLENPRGWDFP